MTSSKCPKCNNDFFELTENIPAKSKFKILFVQCSSCGCVIGVMDYFNIGSKVNKLEEKLADGLESITNNINIINQNLSRLFMLMKEKFK